MYAPDAHLEVYWKDGVGDLKFCVLGSDGASKYSGHRLLPQDPGSDNLDVRHGLTPGALLAIQERDRQISELGYTADVDDLATFGQLALAACCYASPVNLYRRVSADNNNRSFAFADPWPFSRSSDHRATAPDGNLQHNWTIPKKERLRLAVKAAALMIAEIDRQLRAMEHPPETDECDE